MSDLRFCEKKRGRRLIPDKITQTGQKSGLKFRKDCGPTPVARGGSEASACSAPKAPCRCAPVRDPVVFTCMPLA